MSTKVPYLRNVHITPQPDADATRYPFTLPFVADLDLSFDAPVVFFVGENGSGKSTLLEAIADLCDLPVSGGSKNELSARHGPDRGSPLAPVLRAAFAKRPRDSYFFRAETLAHFASLLDERRQDPDFAGDPYRRYGGTSLHTRSHGEAFLTVFNERFESGLFLMDEPESALSPQRQLSLLARMFELAERGGSQFIIATHSPIILTFPGAIILDFDHTPITPITLEQTSHYQITRGILEAPERYWRHLRG